MAGRRGQDNWNANYKNLSEAPTLVKKDNATKYNADDKRIGSWKKGEEVTFINEGKFENHALVRQGKDLFRINLDDLVKPNSEKSAQASMKPQAFGITQTKKYTLDELEDLLLNGPKGVYERSDLTPYQKDYLEDLVLYHSQGEYITDAQLIASFAKVKKDTAFVNAVKTDFSEVIGPFALVAFDLMEKVGLKYEMAQQTKAWFPDAPNYPLMDYAVFTKSDQQIVVSAKAKPGSTNVVKPQDVLALIEKQKVINNKWKTTAQYGLLKVLDANPIATGGVAGLGYLMNKFPSLKRKYPGVTKEAVDNFVANKTNYDQKKWTTFIANNKTLQEAKKNNHKTTSNGKVQSTAINYACEKIIEAETVSTGVCPVTDIFVDAIKNQVYYSVFIQKSNGLVEWKFDSSSDFKEENALKIRTKNSLGGGSDKIGFQP